MKFTIIFFFIFSGNISAQISFNVNEDSAQPVEVKYKAAYNFETSEACINYLIVSQLDDDHYRLKDSVKIFYPKGEIYFRGFYRNGKLNGSAKTFHKNGKMKTEANYAEGKRTGIWNTYTREGALKKKVLFNKGSEFLLEFYNDEGVPTVEKGRGKFIDTIFFAGEPVRILGKVEGGLPEGEWKIFMNGKLIAKEYFKDASFLKGISYSPEIENFQYNKRFHTTFTGEKDVEELQILDFLVCKELKDIENQDEPQAEIRPRNKWFEEFTEIINEDDLVNKIENAWFLVQMQYVLEGGEIKLTINSKASEEELKVVENAILKNKKRLFRRKDLKHYQSLGKTHVFLFYAFIKEGDMFYLKPIEASWNSDLKYIN